MIGASTCTWAGTYHNSAVFVDEGYIIVQGFLFESRQKLLELLLDLALIIRLASDLEPVMLRIKLELSFGLCNH